MSDFEFSDHGSIILLTPMNVVARDWVNEHLATDCLMFGSSVVVEHRYADAILCDLVGEFGFEVTQA